MIISLEELLYVKYNFIFDKYGLECPQPTFNFVASAYFKIFAI